VRSDELLNFGQHPFLIRWIKNFGVNPSKVNKNGFLLAIKEEPSQLYIVCRTYLSLLTTF
jgi:hypothetical protein